MDVGPNPLEEFFGHLAQVGDDPSTNDLGALGSRKLFQFFRALGVSPQMMFVVVNPHGRIFGAHRRCDTRIWWRSARISALQAPACWALSLTAKPGVVYSWCMARTNIDIDEDLCQRVMDRYHLSTKREAVNLALRQVAGEPLGLDEARSMRGTGWDGDLDEMRSSRA